MPKISLSVPHNLGQDDAVERIKGFMPRVRDHYQGQVKDIEESWDGNTLSFGFRTMGMTIQGQIVVEQSEANVEAELPFAAIAFKGMIEKSLRDNLTKLLA